MIRSITIKDGFLNELGLKGRRFDFGPRVNVIFGENGCGKSSILRTISAHSLVPQDGGWSRVPSSLDWQGDVPKTMEKMTPGDILADVEWDGSASYRYESEVALDGYKQWNGIGNGLFGEGSREALLLNSQWGGSAGQKCLMALNKLCDGAIGHKKEVLPDLRPDKLPTDYSGRKDPRARAVKEYIRGLPGRRVRPTMILDEPDRSLSLEMQALLWTSLIPRFVQAGYQVIAASHSPFCLAKQPGKNVIPVSRGYDRLVIRLHELLCEQDEKKAMLMGAVAQAWVEQK